VQKKQLMADLREIDVWRIPDLIIEEKGKREQLAS
jgi:hypothetical protein